MRIFLAFVPFSISLFANSTGAPPKTSWADTNQTCTLCHTGSNNTGAGTVAITFPGNLSYTPGVTQRLTITVTDLSLPVNFGFQATSRVSAGQPTVQAGTWTAVDSSTQVICDDGNVRAGAACPVGFPREFIGHKTSSATGVWQVDWTPPATNVGDIDFFVAGLAGNGNAAATGDRTYLTTSYRLRTASPLIITSPVTLPGGTMLSNYSVKLNATGGTGAYSWNGGGSVPLTLATDGTLSGTPGAAGSFTFTATVVDSAVPPRITYQQFTVNIAPVPGFTTFSIPNAGGTTVYGMNNHGDVVGSAAYANNDPSARAFVRYQNGVVQFIDLPGAAWSLATGINDNGDIVGSFLTNAEHGFLRDVNGNFSSIDRPGHESTRPLGINNQRQITGYSYNGKFNAFIYTFGGAFVDIPASNNIVPAAINNLGQVLGRRYDGTGFNENGVNFLRQVDGSVTEFSPYTRARFSPGTGPVYTGLNSKGVLVSSQHVRRWGEDPVPASLPAPHFPIVVNDVGQIAGNNFILSPCAGSITSPSNGAHGNGTELGSAMVNAASHCFWFAETTDNWITFNRSLGTGGGQMLYSLAANTAGGARTGRINVAGSIFTINQQGTGCTYTVPPGPINVPTAGGSGAIAITTQAGCQWNAGTLAPWVTFSASGTGTGSAPYQVPANTTYASRTATLNVAGQTVNLTQAGLPCSYTIAAPQTVPGSGGTQSLSVQTDSACTWQPVSNSPWITIMGIASNSFSFTVAQNPGTFARTGTISVGGQTVSVFQLGGPACIYQTSPNYLSFNSAGGTGSTLISTGDGCLWNLSTDSSWIVLSNYLVAPSGTAPLSFSVTPNTSGAPRTGTVRVGGISITVVQAAAFSSTGLKFVPLPPCRLMETRALYNFEGRTGAFGPPSLTAAESRTLNLPASNVCNIPSTAKAYVVNVTLIPKTTADFVTVWPAGDVRPAFWTVRSPDGQVVANSAIVRAGTNGGISVHSSDAADLLIDISGYYTDSTAVTGLAFYPMTPCRVIDTRVQYRPEAGPFGPPSIAARQTRKFRFPSGSYCTVPAAAAYSVTLTAVPPGSLAYITAWPDGGQQPNVSSINSFSGRTLANSVIIPASADGSINVFAYDATDFLMDINGYFAPDDGVNGQLYFPVTQCRLSDSIASALPYTDGATRTISVPSAAACPGLPAGARGYALNFTAVPNGNPMPFLTAYPTGQAQPNASVLNAFQGQTISNSAIIPAGTGGAIDVYAFRRTDVVVEIAGYFGR